MSSWISAVFILLNISLLLARTADAQESKVLKNWDFDEAQGWTYGNEIIDPH